MTRRVRNGWGGSAGKGTLRALITMLLFGSFAYAAFKVIPVRAAAYQLDDAMREEIVLAGARRRRVTDQEIRRTIMERAEDLGIPLETRNLTIRRTRTQIFIEATYTIDIVFPGYTVPWTFHSSHDGPVF